MRRLSRLTIEGFALAVAMLLIFAIFHAVGEDVVPNCGLPHYVRASC